MMGMPPFLPHGSDPTRGVLAALDARAALAARGIGAGVGVTTGTALSGFVGGAARRELCAMGSVVNLAARLMVAAGDGVLVDGATVEASSAAVGPRDRP